MSSHATKKYRARSCVMCGANFMPHHPRSRQCPACSQPKCRDCGRPIATSLRRRLASRARRCADCHAAPHGCDGPGHALPVGATRRSPGDSGYIRVKVSPTRWMLQHRHVMELKLGRALTSNEQVHHLDGNPANNAPENLALCAGLRDHLDTHHKADLKPPPIHHNGRRRKDGTWAPDNGPRRKRSDAGKPRAHYRRAT